MNEGDRPCATGPPPQADLRGLMAGPTCLCVAHVDFSSEPMPPLATSPPSANGHRAISAPRASDPSTRNLTADASPSSPTTTLIAPEPLLSPSPPIAPEGFNPVLDLEPPRPPLPFPLPAPIPLPPPPALADMALRIADVSRVEPEGVAMRWHQWIIWGRIMVRTSAGGTWH